MRQHFVTVPLYDGAAAEEELNRFLASHRVIGIERHFVADGPRSVWALCVSWVVTPPREEGSTPAEGRKGRVDYRETLSAEDFAVFVKLRDTRNALAERDGVPPYAVFTNEQLAEVVRRKVTSTAGLAQIEGVGPARIEKYGAALLAALPPALPASPDAPA